MPKSMMNNISKLLKKIESVTVLDHSESWGQRKNLKEKQNENKRKNTDLVFIENFDICSSWIFVLIFKNIALENSFILITELFFFFKSS